ncbi:hypothetical protein EVAR_65991_1 [Eumeta japonica]|uniref:Uncharacterized protein n=1 Tax=Eumeta variegata TaxID=151549 RepID=A0A4C1ZL25_EUMVA|nr:hypothetical protein EVAR_65991_1 [Eumeta japonica]
MSDQTGRSVQLLGLTTWLDASGHFECLKHTDRKRRATFFYPITEKEGQHKQRSDVLDRRPTESVNNGRKRSAPLKTCDGRPPGRDAPTNELPSKALGSTKTSEGVRRPAAFMTAYVNISRA